MLDAEYYIPIYKTCPDCKGSGDLMRGFFHDPKKCVRCSRCNSLGAVPVLIELEEFADLTDMDEIALLNLYGPLSEA